MIAHACRIALWAAALGLFALLVVATPLAAGAAPGQAPVFPAADTERTALALDAQNATELFANQSVSGSLAPPNFRLFKVFANRSLANPETLVFTIEASGGNFALGSATIFDPHHVVLDERFTWFDTDFNVSRIIVPETGYYFITVQANQLYYWSLTVNLSVSIASPLDNDNDIANASWLPGPSGLLSGNVTDWQDLVDIYAFNLTDYGATSDVILFNLTSPYVADLDLDLYLFHLESGIAVIDSQSISPYGIEFAQFLATANRTYYLWVMSYNLSSPYDLQWWTLNASADDNGSPAKALPLTTGAYTNSLARWDLSDVFRFDVPANTTVNITAHTLGYNTTIEEPNLQLELLDATFARVSWSFLFDPDERIHVFLPQAGAYYFFVYAADNAYFVATNLSFDYELQVRVDPPPALADPSWAPVFSEDLPAAIDLAVVIPPDPAGENLAYQITAVSGSVVALLAPDGRTLEVVPAPDWSGNATLWVEARDAWQVVTLVLTLAWAPVDDPPRLRAGADNFTFDEDAHGAILLAATMVDIEGDFLLVTAVEAQPPLTAVAAPGGYDLSAPPNYNGLLRLNFTVQDSLGANAVLRILVTVRPVNDAPVFQVTVGPFVIAEDADAADASFSLAGFAIDPDGDAVTYSISAIPNAAALVLGNALTFYPARNFAGRVSGTLFARDGALATGVPVTLEIAPVNDAPSLDMPLTQRFARENDTLTVNADATDPDTPAPDLRYSFYRDGAPVAVSGTSPSVVLSFNFDDAGAHVLRIVVSDGYLNTSADLAIFVAETNRPPSAAILSPRGSHFRAGEVVLFSAQAQDPDGQPLNVSWIIDGTLVSTSLMFSLEGLSGGSHSVLLLVSDGEASAADESSFTSEAGGAAPGEGAAGLIVAVGLAAAVARKRRP